jgi:hypothetical protein
MQEVEELMQLRFLLGYACSSDGWNTKQKFSVAYVFFLSS